MNIIILKIYSFERGEKLGLERFMDKIRVLGSEERFKDEIGFVRNILYWCI